MAKTLIISLSIFLSVLVYSASNYYKERFSFWVSNPPFLMIIFDRHTGKHQSISLLNQGQANNFNK